MVRCAKINHCGVSSFRRIGEAVQLQMHILGTGVEPAVHTEALELWKFLEKLPPALRVRWRKRSVPVQLPELCRLDEDFCSHHNRSEPTKRVEKTRSLRENVSFRERSNGVFVYR